MKFKSIFDYTYLGIGLGFFILIHFGAFLLQTTTSSSRAFRAWQNNDWKTAQSYREKSSKDNPNNAYNLGTLLAQQSVVSGIVTDISLLQRAESLLSGANIFNLSKKNELIHNLETVRALLAQSGSGQQDQQQQSGTSGDNQQQQNSGSGEQNQEEQQQSGAGEPLSESMKQQLASYQKQLEQEQTANQQFYGKEQGPPSGGDPFDLLNQFFGGSPQLQQNVGNDGKPDW